MTTKQILLSTLILGATTNIALAMESNSPREFAMYPESSLHRKFNRRGNFFGTLWVMRSSFDPKAEELHREIEKLNPDPYDTEGQYKAIDTIEQRCKLDSRGKGCAGLLAVYTEMLDSSTKKLGALQEMRFFCISSSKNESCKALWLTCENMEKRSVELQKAGFFYDNKKDEKLYLEHIAAERNKNSTNFAHLISSLNHEQQ